ncbi:LPD7 domain-containing protein [Rahnella sp. ChDrAdgB13]|uniref:LPD7 domain-containing protein n=1 Tax=Rahnella sp. ChDrAdgB13 TaxID=1850581 RepID=UPI001AD86846|nr:LPD7 domain-containing protein [Rahnella sp. ChDrAdgB13]
MLIRVSGYNSGVKEYLEEGVKNGREFTREELDERLILYGDLDLTEKVYQSIPDRGQNRYTTFTLSFKEDEISEADLQNITREMREFIVYAYEGVEYNFYAEAHIPKIKTVYDKRTGVKIERKPHIHIFIPKINLLSGRVSDVIGVPESTEKYLEAFQEYINQKYSLASPREHVRVDPYNYSDVLSRYKGDDFRGRHREFKQSLIKEIINSNIQSRDGFYSLVGNYGETRIRNAGKDNEYIAVKLEGDRKFTNLKETIFSDSFIVERKLVRPPLAKHVIAERLSEWPMRAKEIKYIVPASKKFRHDYYQNSDPVQKLEILSEQQFAFYEKFGGSNELHPTQWERSDERSAAENREGGHASASHGVQDLSGGIMAADGKAGRAGSAVFLPGNARIHLEPPAAGGDPRLRSGLPLGRAGRGKAGGEEGETDREAGTSAEEGGGEHRTGTTPEEPGSSTPGERSPRRPHPGGTEGGTKHPERGESTGSRGESRTSAYPGSEETAENEFEENTGSGLYPGDTGSREADRYAFIPELGSADAARQRRGGARADRLGSGIPVYARHGLRVPDISAVEKNTTRLFSDTLITPSPRSARVRLIRRVMPKTPKNASYLAASLQRRQEQSALTGDQRRALYQVDKKYFETRRLILSDSRLSVKDKTQLLAVLTFERFKAHQQITQPQGLTTQENDTMGSKNIRKNIRKEHTWRNTISRPEENEPEAKGAKQRFAKMSQEMEENLGERSIREKVRIITAADLYTRKARLSNNIHYLDKSNDKTLFVDTGNSIAVSKNGLSESSVAVALELAKEKFGSTLTVKGTEAFKNTAIEVVAQKGLDIHFTDKEMNRRLAERKQELAIERDGQNISTGLSPQPIPTSAEGFREAFATLEKGYQAILAGAQERTGAESEKQFNEARQTRKELTLAYLELPDSDPVNGPDKVCRELETEIHEMLENVTPEQRDSAQENAQPQAPEQASKSVTHEGVLLEHGNAPYNFNPDMSKPENERDDSYYVKLQRPDGSEKVIWGVTLEQAVQGLNLGERVGLTNLGKEKVEWDQKLANGQTEHRSGERVAWEGKPLDREVDNEVPPQHENKQGNHAAEAEYDGPSVD